LPLTVLIKEAVSILYRALAPVGAAQGSCFLFSTELLPLTGLLKEDVSIILEL